MGTQQQRGQGPGAFLPGNEVDAKAPFVGEGVAADRQAEAREGVVQIAQRLAMAVVVEPLARGKLNYVGLEAAFIGGSGGRKGFPGHIATYLLAGAHQEGRFHGPASGHRTVLFLG